ncbi:MAG: hypothetical protein DMG41_00550 [Acidobacteria bacterium]|nr:MAG: hypothetical protein DMG42_07555 [Acidobacteriota bacterium]PYT92040.1 MAG: hypothetical protein DMG41_00550 [Acidobacteriota bacterium]
MTAKQETQSLRKSPSHERPESPFNRGQWDKNESDAVHMKCISNVAESREPLQAWQLPAQVFSS